MSMTRSIGRGACVALLAGVLLLAGTVPLPAGEPAAVSHLVPIPPDCAGFVSVRCAEMLGKFGIRAGADLPPWLKNTSGDEMCPTDVERITNVWFADCSEPAIIMQASKPLPKDAMLEMNNAREVKELGKDCYSAPTGEVLYFASDRLLYRGNWEAVKQCLPRPDIQHVAPPTLSDALAQAEKHDVVAWVRTSLLPESENFKPTNIGVQLSTVTLDFGKQVTGELRLHCSDKAHAHKAAKSLRAVVDLARGQLTAFSGLLEVGDLMPSAATSIIPQVFPRKLSRAAANGLQRATVRPEGTTVTMSLSIAMDAETLRREIEKFAKESGGDWTCPLPFLGTKLGQCAPRAPCEQTALGSGPLPCPPPGCPSAPAPAVSLPPPPPPSAMPALPELVPVACSQVPSREGPKLQLTVANLR